MKRTIGMAAVASVFLSVLATPAIAQMGGGRGSPTAGAQRSLGATATAQCTVGPTSIPARQASPAAGSRSGPRSPGILRGLQAGMAVQVQYHNSGSGPVADQVTAAR